eukprot:11447935-Alexandrium_andersonii.AAC.1
MTMMPMHSRSSVVTVSVLSAVCSASSAVQQVQVAGRPGRPTASCRLRPASVLALLGLVQIHARSARHTAVRARPGTRRPSRPHALATFAATPPL